MPENFAFLGDDSEKLKLSGDLAIKCTNFLKTMSQRYQVFLLGGGYPVPAGDNTHILNRSALYGKDGLIRAGFIAQELQEAQSGSEYLDLVMDENPDKLEAKQGKLIPVLVKAIQELSAKNESLEARIKTLEG